MVVGHEQGGEVQEEQEAEVGAGQQQQPHEGMRRAHEATRDAPAATDEVQVAALRDGEGRGMQVWYAHRLSCVDGQAKLSWLTPCKQLKRCVQLKAMAAEFQVDTLQDEQCLVPVACKLVSSNPPTYELLIRVSTVRTKVKKALEARFTIPTID